MSYNICMLGCGNLGSAIAKGIVASNFKTAKEVMVTCRNPENLKSMTTAGFTVTNDNKSAVNKCKVIILGVLPKVLPIVIEDIKSQLREDHLIISVISGATISDIKKLIGNPKIEVVRAMPNTAIAVRESMTCICGETREQKGIAIAKEIFEGVGKTMIIDEEQMVAATALCSSAIAFYCRMIRASAQGGTEIGFHAHEANEMAAQTARGAATLLLQHGNHPELAVDRVTTPSGCTITGLNTMEHNGLSSAIIKGVVAARDKAAGGIVKTDKQ